MKVSTQDLKDDFVKFYKYKQRVRGVVPDRFQVHIAEELAKMGSDWNDHESEDYQFIFLASWRGLGKSDMLKDKILHILWNNPIARIIYTASASYLSELKVFEARLDIENKHDFPFLHRDLFPGKSTKNSLWNKSIWNVKRPHGSLVRTGVNVRASGSETSVTGSRADWVIVDDFEDPKNAGTTEKNQKLMKTFKENVYNLGEKGGSRGVLTKVIVAGTYHHTYSFYNDLMKISDFKCLFLPIEYPTVEEMDKYFGGGKLLLPQLYDEIMSKPELAGKPTSERYTPESLSRFKATVQEDYKRHYLIHNDLDSANDRPFLFKNLRIVEIETPVSLPSSFTKKEPARIYDTMFDGLYKYDDYSSKDGFFMTSAQTLKRSLGNIMVIDPAGKGLDECAYTVAGTNGSYIFVLDTGGYKDGTADSIWDAFNETINKYAVTKVYIEHNYSKGLYTSLFKTELTRRGCYVEIEEYVSTYEKKFIRIVNDAQDVVRSKCVFISKELMDKEFLEFNKRDTDIERILMYQYINIRVQREVLNHDDRIETFAKAIYYCSLKGFATPKEIEYDMKTISRRDQAIYGYKRPKELDKSIVYLTKEDEEFSKEFPIVDLRTDKKYLDSPSIEGV